MTVLKEGAAMASLGGLMGAMTLVFMATMIGWILWAWWPSRTDAMNAAAALPLED